MSPSANPLIAVPHVREALLLDEPEREQNVRIGAFRRQQQTPFRRGVHHRILDEIRSRFWARGGARADETVLYQKKAVQAARRVSSHEAGTTVATHQHLEEAGTIPAKDFGIELEHLIPGCRSHGAGGWVTLPVLRRARKPDRRSSRLETESLIDRASKRRGVERDGTGSFRIRPFHEVLREPGRMAATSNCRVRPDKSHPGKAPVNNASTHRNDPIVFFDHTPAVRLHFGVQLEFMST